MIGQKYLFKRIIGQISNGKFPVFSIFVGEPGSGRKTLIKEVADLLNLPLVTVSANYTGISSVTAKNYTSEVPCMYLIPECDDLTEDAIKELYDFIFHQKINGYLAITCENIDNLPYSIKHHGVVYMMEPYSYEEKCDYLDCVGMPDLSDDDIEFLLDVSSNIGDLKTLLGSDLTKFREYVTAAVKDPLNAEDALENCDLRLFLNAFISICGDMVHDNDGVIYANASAITGDYLRRINIRGIYEQDLFDEWFSVIKDCLPPLSNV